MGETDEFKVGLLGQFGSGNIGNDGSLQAMRDFLLEAAPSAELLCICSGPERIEHSLGLKSTSISVDDSIDDSGRFAAGLRRKFANLRYAFATSRRLDLIVIPGTGILDDFRERPFGWPYCLLRWCAAARIAGTPVALVSVGAGPATNWLSRLFFLFAARCARYRTYRDAGSIEFMQRLGCRAHDGEFPDLAFRLRTPAATPRPASARFCVGLGVMAYSGWSKDGDDEQRIGGTYAAKIEELTRRLVLDNVDVRLLTGGVEDEALVRMVLNACENVKRPADAGVVIANPIGSLDELMLEIAKTNVVVASRYHNIVCALKMARPAISLSYAPKNDALLIDAQLSSFRHHVESFDVDAVANQIDVIRRDPFAWGAGIREALEAHRRLQAKQDGMLALRFLPT